MLKMIDLKLFPQEIEIHRYLTSLEVERNYAAPILDWFPDALDPTFAIAVLPLLRDIERPPPATISECVDFVKQTLEVNFTSRGVHIQADDFHLPRAWPSCTSMESRTGTHHALTSPSFICGVTHHSP